MYKGTTRFSRQSVLCTYLIMCVFGCTYYRLETISADKSSALSKATEANEHCKLLLTEKDLQLKKCQERYIRTLYCT